MCPVDFDDNSLEAVDTAASIVRQNNGTLILAHIRSDDYSGCGHTDLRDLYKGQEETARRQLAATSASRLNCGL
jgi:Universal stress protein family